MEQLILKMNVMCGMLAEARSKLMFFLNKSKTDGISDNDLLRIEQIGKDLAKYQKQCKIIEEQIQQIG